MNYLVALIVIVDIITYVFIAVAVAMKWLTLLHSGILFAVVTVMSLISIVILLITMRHKKVIANAIKIIPTGGKNQVVVGDIMVLNSEGTNLIPIELPFGKPQEQIQVSFGGDQEIKRITVKDISGGSIISLVNLSNEVPFSHEFKEDSAYKEFNL